MPMKTSLRFLSVILVLLFIAIPLLSCEDKGEETSEVSAVSENPNSFFGLDIPENLNFGGKTLRVLTTATVQSPTCCQIKPESNAMYSSENSTAILTAASECTRLVEEKLGLEVEEEVVYTWSRYGGDMYKKIYTDSLSGTTDYDFCMPCVIEAAMLATDGLLYNLKAVNNLDLSHEWWCAAFNDAVTIADSCYFITGDIGTSSKDATLFVAFNKKMVQSMNLTEKYGYDSLYDMVEAKAWTQDVMYEMAKSVYQDLNRNNRSDIGDVLGIAGQDGIIYWMLEGADENIIGRDSDGYPVITVKNERAIKVISDAQEYFLDSQSGFISANDYFSVSQVPVRDVIVPEFKADRCLFFMDSLMNLENIRDMESDFGVLPCPLYDKTQENYHSNIGCWSTACICIPTSTVDDELDKTAWFLEALGAVSKKKLNPVYYEQTLQYQIARDDESMKMLDIIFETRTPELAEAFRWGGLQDVVSGMLKAPKDTFVSAFEAVEDAAKAAIEETVEEFKSR